MNFNLDFSIETSPERKAFIESHDLSTLTKKELELCSNYILYGKDPDKDMTSVVDRKEVQIKTKFSSYSKTEPVSLDALLESPTFNENIIQKNPTIYKKVKPTLDKEKAKNIPGMEDLWEQIQKFQNLLENRELNSKQKYYIKHQLIDMRKQQYLLFDSVYPTLPPPQNKGQYYQSIQDSHLNYPVFPRGVMRVENDEDFKNPRIDRNDCGRAIDLDNKIQYYKDSGKPYFNFLDKEHIYQLILNYWDIKIAIENIPDSPLWNLLWTLDFYIEKANLNEQQQLIVRDKKLRLLNREISNDLQKELGIYHQENYVSTIWNKITQLIADAAELNYDEWISKDYDKAWKKCNTCGKELLRDPRNFVRKSKTKDGLTNTCKCCDREKRRARK